MHCYCTECPMMFHVNSAFSNIGCEASFCFAIMCLDPGKLLTGVPEIKHTVVADICIFICWWGIDDDGKDAD